MWTKTNPGIIHTLDLKAGDVDVYKFMCGGARGMCLTLYQGDDAIVVNRGDAAKLAELLWDFSMHRTEGDAYFGEPLKLKLGDSDDVL